MSAYRRAKGKSISVSTHFSLSDRAKKVYKLLFYVIFVILFAVIIGAENEIISIGLALLIGFASIIILIAVPIFITLRDRGKDAVLQEIRENKVKAVIDYDYKLSAFGKSYDNTKVTIDKKENIPETVIDNKDDTPVAIIDETGSSK